MSYDELSQIILADFNELASNEDVINCANVRDHRGVQELYLQNIASIIGLDVMYFLTLAEMQEIKQKYADDYHAMMEGTYDNNDDDDFYSSPTGYLVLPSHPLAELRPPAGYEDSVYLNLTLGTYDINGYDNIQFENKIPQLYCVRSTGRDYSSFVCGLDLKEDGTVWVGIGDRDNRTFDSIEAAMSYVESIEGKPCYISLEEPMMVNQDCIERYIIY